MDYVLVTGASSGVGKEIAILLSKDYNIVLSGRDDQRLAETKSLCKNDAVIWKHDLADFDGIEDSLGKLIDEHGLDISGFVHSAGVMKMLPLRGINCDTLMQVYSVNVFSAALITKLLSSKRINGNSLKSIVFVSSNISNRGAAAFSVYGSSKSALDGLMRSLSVELAPRVRVNSVLPGGMETEMTKEIYSDEGKKAMFEKNTPLGIGKPSDIASVVEFLLSDRSSWITGQQITVDGGRTIDITERGGNG